jgi:tight adherence protein C
MLPVWTVISILAGACVALVALGAVGLAMERPARRLTMQDAPRAVDMPQRLLPLLRMVPLPGWAERRWAGEGAAKLLQQAGLAWEGRANAALRWAALWLGAACGVGLVVWRGGDPLGQFLALLLVGAGIWAPGAWLSWRVEKRREEIDLGLPDLLDRLSLGLEAGLGFEVALRRTAAHARGLLGDELRLLVRELDRGTRRDSALDALAERNASQDLRAFAAAVKQADRLGTSLAKALRVQTYLLRGRRRRRAQEASRRLPILIVFPLVFFFLPALLIIYLAPPLLHLFLGR